MARRSECDISEEYSTTFSPVENRFSKQHTLLCPYCSHSLVPKKNGKNFIIYKCVNLKCSYYLHNNTKVPKEGLEGYKKYGYKPYYLYREFTSDFTKMDLDTLPKNASSFKFGKNDTHIMSLCLTMHVNLGLSIYKTAQAFKVLYGINISHPILGCQVSNNLSVGLCILSMLMVFRHLKNLPINFRFIAGGYSVYPLSAQQFFREFGDAFKSDITQVIGHANDDKVSKESRTFKQMVERLNRTFKNSFRVSC